MKGQEGRRREAEIFLCKVGTARGGESGPHRIYSVCCRWLRLFRCSQQCGCVVLGGHDHLGPAAPLTVSTQYRMSSTHRQHVTPLLVGLMHLCPKSLEQCSPSAFFSSFLAPSHVDTGKAEPFSCPQISTEWLGSLGTWGYSRLSPQVLKPHNVSVSLNLQTSNWAPALCHMHTTSRDRMLFLPQRLHWGGSIASVKRYHRWGHFQLELWLPFQRKFLPVSPLKLGNV